MIMAATTLGTYSRVSFGSAFTRPDQATQLLVSASSKRAADDHGGDDSGNIFARFFRQRVYSIQIPEVALLDRVVDSVHDGLLDLRGPQIVCSQCQHHRLPAPKS